MPNSTTSKGLISVVQRLENGRIVQLGITPEQAYLLNALITKMSKETPIQIMSEKYDLVLKSTVKAFKSKK